MSRYSRAQSSERDHDTLGMVAFCAGLAGLGLGYFGVPTGVCIWLGALAFSAIWPERPQDQAAGIPSFTRILAKHLANPVTPEMGPCEAGWAGPPTRINAMWSAVFAVAVCSFPVLLHGVYSGPSLPMRYWWTGVPFAFVVGQAYGAARRETISRGTIVPPTVLEEARLRAAAAKMLGPGITACLLGGVSSLGLFLAGSYLAGDHPKGTVLPISIPVPFSAVVATSVVVGLLCGLAAALYVYSKSSLEPWHETQNLAKLWQGRWMQCLQGKRLPPPLFINETPIGATEEDRAFGCVQAAFNLPPGKELSAYLGVRENLATLLGSPEISINPAAMLDENGQASPTQVSAQTFIVTYGGRQLGDHPHLRSDLSNDIRSFVVRAVFDRVFDSVKLPPSRAVAIAVHSAPDSNGALIETLFVLNKDVTLEKLLLKRAAIREKLGVAWLQIGRRSTNRPGAMPSNYVSIVYGADPATIRFADEEKILAAELLDDSDPTKKELLARARASLERTKAFLDQLSWDGIFRACGLTSGDGDAPTLLQRIAHPQDVSEAIFAFPDGISLVDVMKAVPRLRATSGFGYIGVGTDPDASRFRLTFAVEDPLNREFRFETYRDRLIRPPVPGRPDLTWTVGVAADGSFLVDRFEDSEEPHLLIAGTSGMGKSVLVHSMILQLAHKNDPADLEFRMVEPKLELQIYRSLAHTSYFVENVAGRSLYEMTADMLRETYAELQERNRKLSAHPDHPQTVRDARALGLHFPNIVVVLEEVASIFRKPPGRSGSSHAAYEEISFLVEELARLGRALGINLVMATQYPTKENLPATVKQQSRRIGLAVASTTASIVVIDQTGLESFDQPGRGLMTSPGAARGYREFRGLLLGTRERNELVGSLAQHTVGPQAVTGAALRHRAWPVPPGIWDEDGQPIGRAG